MNPMPINAAWHEQHRMPARASLDERVEWHLAHAAACACRAIPRSVALELKARGLAPGRPRKPRKRPKRTRAR